MASKYQGSGVPPKLRSQIMAEILLPNSSVSKIAKKHNLSSTTLYGWHRDHSQKITR
jgi:transposase-like protein